MKRMCLNACSALIVLTAIAVPAVCQESELGEWGDAPEGATAYLSPAVLGQFPTCFGVPLASYIYHGPLCWAHFPGPLPPPFDFEVDGNAGLCPNFAPYDMDECFGADAGLMFPEPYTIDATPAVVPCPGFTGTPLGNVCNIATWGTDIDIMVANTFMPCVGYVNVIIDWDQSGFWGGSSTCPGPVTAPEHVLVNFPVPMGYNGPLSGLGPGSFIIGPNDQFVWARFTISETPVLIPWDGSGGFEDGETEDYLLKVLDPTVVEDQSWGVIKGLYR